MKIQTQTIGETLAVIQLRYNYSLKELSDIFTIPEQTLKRKMSLDKFTANERISIIEFLKGKV